MMSVMILVKSTLPEGSATPGLIISLIEEEIAMLTDLAFMHAIGNFTKVMSLAAAKKKRLVRQQKAQEVRKSSYNLQTASIRNG